MQASSDSSTDLPAISPTVRERLRGPVEAHRRAVARRARLVEGSGPPWANDAVAEVEAVLGDAFDRDAREYAYTLVSEKWGRVKAGAEVPDPRALGGELAHKINLVRHFLDSGSHLAVGQFPTIRVPSVPEVVLDRSVPSIGERLAVVEKHNARQAEALETMVERAQAAEARAVAAQGHASRRERWMLRLTTASVCFSAVAAVAAVVAIFVAT